jgi:F-type H+-transporting ATPase subunit b
MEATLQALGALLLKAVPTIFLLLIVHFYLKWMFFRPMAGVLAKRREETAGVRESAAAIRARADEQAASVEARLRQVRDEIYREQEEMRRGWTAEQAKHLENAHAQARDLIHKSKEQLDAEAVAAKQQLAATTDELAEEITRTLLERSAA